MLQFEESTFAPGLALQPVGFARAPSVPRASRRRRAAGRARAPHQGRGQAHHQRQDRRQPARAVQVQMGLGEVPGLLRESLDAAGDEHEPRHRPVEGPRRPDRGRAPRRQAQPRLLRDRRQPGRQQHRAGHLSPHQRPGVPAVPAAPGLRRGDPHPRLPVHRGEPGPGRRRDVQRLPRDPQHPGQGRVPDPVHRHAHRSRRSRPARRRPTSSCSRA